MEKVQTVDNGVVEVVTSTDLLVVSRRFWFWMVSVGFGLLVASTAWAVSLKNQVDAVSQYGTEPQRRMQKSLDSLTVVVGYLVSELKR